MDVGGTVLSPLALKKFSIPIKIMSVVTFIMDQPGRTELLSDRPVNEKIQHARTGHNISF